MIRKLSFALFFVSTVILPAAAQENKVPVTPAGRDNPGWMARHQQLVERAKKGNIDVMFLGDSITQGWEGGPPAAIWQKHFAPLKAGNFGIGGDETQHVLWRLQNGELEPLHPKVAVIMIGTNNAGNNGMRDSAADIAAGITAIVKELRDKRPETKILLLGVFPRAEKPTDELRLRLAKVNEIIAKLDDGKQVKYRDIGSIFLQRNGNLARPIMPDFLHLSEEGYRRWALAIEPPIRDMLGLSAIAATAAPHTNAMKRHEMLLERSKNNHFDVMFLGDSITQGWEGAPNVWKKHFEPLKAGNFGIGGDQTQHVLWRLQNGELEPQQPKAAVVMIGTNNFGRDTPTEVVAGVEAILKELRTKRPDAKILLLGVFPRGQSLHDPLRIKALQVNSLLAKLKADHVRFLDIGHVFLENDGSLSPKIMPDYLHLSEEGYERWAAAIEKPLQELLGK